MHPNLSFCWPMIPLIIGLPHNYPHPSGSQQFAYDELWLLGNVQQVWTCSCMCMYYEADSKEIKGPDLLQCNGPSLLTFNFQDNIYVDVEVDKNKMLSNVSTSEELKTAVIPPTFHKCDKQGAQPGCKFRFDSPQKQCSEKRDGMTVTN